MHIYFLIFMVYPFLNILNFKHPDFLIFFFNYLKLLIVLEFLWKHIDKTFSFIIIFL